MTPQTTFKLQQLAHSIARTATKNRHAAYVLRRCATEIPEDHTTSARRVADCAIEAHEDQAKTIDDFATQLTDLIAEELTQHAPHRNIAAQLRRRLRNGENN